MIKTDRNIQCVKKKMTYCNIKLIQIKNKEKTNLYIK